jgi:hypothetical protein
MFCCGCGARNPNDASFCHKCGSPLYKEKAGRLGPSSAGKKPQKVEKPQGEEERRLIEELTPIDQKPHECHVCGGLDSLSGWDFGLGKKISTKSAWGKTALSVAVSAAASAFTLAHYGTGFMRLRLPDTKTRYQVLRLRLILCESCRRQHMVVGGSHQVDVAIYGLHPWFEPARRLGYAEYFDADGLKKLEPAR